MNVILVACGGDVSVSIDLRCAMDTKHGEIKVMSVNVNGLGKPVKRAKIRANLPRHRLICIRCSSITERTQEAEEIRIQKHLL